MRIFRRVIAGALLLLVLVLAAAGGIVWLTLPPGSQTLHIAGLAEPVTIRMDRHGVPYIRAASLADAATALGYLHARDRMFQMDLMRRAASGRLSALFGSAALPYDELMRTLGLAEHARETLATLPAATRVMLDAYARGVNAWIAARGRFAAPQYLFFGAPAPWTPLDSLLWGETMSLSLSGNWRTELARFALLGHLPRDRILALWPSSPEAAPVDASLAPAARFATALLRFLPRFPAPFTEPETASNEWAVSGLWSATGAPLLAGDPHLGLDFPSLWYLVHIETPGTTLIGATAPGIPFLVLGHNRHIAWTFTDAGADTEDVFIETVLPDGRYLAPDGPQPFKTRTERIKVRGRPDVILTVRSTRHGPVISDLSPYRGGPVIAVEMAGLQPDDLAAAGLFALDRAQTIADAGRAAAEISTPVLNLLVADRTHIGYFMTGRVPIRRAGDGAMPEPGASGAYDWTGFASGDALPHIVDPPSGRLVNANEPVDLPGFPVFLSRDSFGPWRARRIRQMLTADPRATPADFAAMQADPVSSFAGQVLPVLERVTPPSGAPARALELLRGWHGAMDRNLAQPLIFNAWLRRFRALIFARLGISDNGAAPGPEFLARVLAHGGRSSWCGTAPASADAAGKPADCAPLLTMALTQAVSELSSRYGSDPSGWRWGRAHPAVFVDPVLARLPLLGWLTACRIAAPGDDTTVDRGAPGPSGFTDVQGAEYRADYDLADLDRSRFMMAPGQAGDPFAAHACDLVRPWRDGKTFTLGGQPAGAGPTIRLLP
ncbi:MAG TPA: penicillin acylase family protein [Acetobacteraceae bacterium]|nr:penicillin acylase family protein [Acetobacteraceae bacterium]